MLENYIKVKLKIKKILLMTHIVIGYPGLAESYEIIKKMYKAGVDIMELQIPFSEPIADGSVILNANQEALKKGIKIADCFELAQKAAKEFDIPFLFMSYYNILFKYGVADFILKMKDAGLKGAIVPDLPHEEGEVYIKEMNKNDLSPIFIYSPTTSFKRMKTISGFGNGFIYSVARKGVTGLATDFSSDLEEYIKKCKSATRLPLALGFGVKEKKDIDFLKGKVEIAVIGSETIKIIDNKGIDAVEEFINGLI